MLGFSLDLSSLCCLPYPFQEAHVRQQLSCVARKVEGASSTVNGGGTLKVAYGREEGGRWHAAT